MAISDKIYRFYFIIDYLSRGLKTKEEIISKISSNHNYSLRSFQRDIKDLRDEYGIEVKYRQNYGYYIASRPEDFDYRNFLYLLEVSVKAQIMIESLQVDKKAKEYLLFDSFSRLKGIHWMEKLIFSIKMHRVIKIRHQNFQTQRITGYTIRPYFLKEYRNRWYLFGFVSGKLQDYRIFGIERIVDLEVTDTTFEPDKSIKFKEKFSPIIGVSTKAFDSQPIQTFVFTTSPEQGRYLKSLPLHESFTSIIDNDKEFRFSLMILPNIEFIQNLLHYSNKITVIEPQWLRETMRNLLFEAVARYQ